MTTLNIKNLIPILIFCLCIGVSTSVKLQSANFHITVAEEHHDPILYEVKLADKSK